MCTDKNIFARNENICGCLRISGSSQGGHLLWP